MTTKERILQEAEKRFIDSGIANTLMKDIAAVLNINRRTLYRYFPTKDELAFEVEMIVMKQIQNYFSIEVGETENNTGFEKLEKYFDNVNFDDIKDLIKFTAEFDRYFQDDYPTPQLEESFVLSMNPHDDLLYKYISEGIKDGSIRNDISADNLFHFISQDFFALFQRLILREKHLENEYYDQVDFQQLFKDILLSGMKNKS